MEGAKIMKRKLFVISFVMALVIAGCAYNLNYATNTYKLLSVAQTSYETTIETVIDLHRQGRIDAEEKERIFAIGRDYA
jgi:outer membrane lipoprotein SlyB